MDIGKMFGQQHQTVTVTQAQLDTFINRVMSEKDETLYSMAQVLQYKLQQAPMISVAESQVYPLVIQRIQQRLQNGEK
jgi:hypothetical protein